MLPLYWAGALSISLSPITAYSDGDGASFTQYADAGLVNIAHIRKLNEGARNHSNSHMKINPLSQEPLIG